LAYEEEVFEKALNQQVRKDLAKVDYTFRRKGLATNFFTTNVQMGMILIVILIFILVGIIPTCP
jgi:hypothetical protein